MKHDDIFDNENQFSMKYEVSDFHPLVENWLTKNGYTYEHEVKLDDGRVDFVATHKKTGEVLAVEAKLNGGERGRFFAQVLDYARQIPGAVPAVALPSYRVTNKTHEICNHYGIRLITIKARRAGLSDSANSPRAVLPEIPFVPLTKDEWREIADAIYLLFDDDTASRIIRTLFMIGLKSIDFRYYDGLLDFLCECVPPDTLGRLFDSDVNGNGDVLESGQ